eukprot:818189_1
MTITAEEMAMAMVEDIEVTTDGTTAETVDMVTMVMAVVEEDTVVDHLDLAADTAMEEGIATDMVHRSTITIVIVLIVIGPEIDTMTTNMGMEVDMDMAVEVEVDLRRIMVTVTVMEE